MDTVVGKINKNIMLRSVLCSNPYTLHNHCTGCAMSSPISPKSLLRSQSTKVQPICTQLLNSKLRCSQVTLKLWIKFTQKCTSAVQWPECRDFVRDSSIAALALWSIELEPFLGSYTKPPSSQFRLLIKISNFEQDWKRTEESWQKREKWPWASQPYFLAQLLCIVCWVNFCQFLLQG